MKVVLSPNPYRDRGLRAAQAAEKILRNVGGGDRHVSALPPGGQQSGIPKAYPV